LVADSASRGGSGSFAVGIGAIVSWLVGRESRT
jgi:hypothetical protein